MDDLEDAPAIKTRSAQVSVGGVPTNLLVTAYSNRFFILISQSESFGTLVRDAAAQHISISVCTPFQHLMLSQYCFQLGIAEPPNALLCIPSAKYRRCARLCLMRARRIADSRSPG